MDTKRLAEIKERADKSAIGEWVYDVSNNRINCGHYLIAENTEYEADALFVAHARQDVPELVAEVERLQSELSKAVEYADYRIKYSQQLTEELSEAYSENEQLRKALEFYADLGNHDDFKPYCENCLNSAIDYDKGQIAREALAWRNTTRK